MMKPDDSSLTPPQLAKIREEARRVLEEAGAVGTFPTPVPQIMQVARVEEVTEDVLSPTFVASLRRKAGNTLKRALTKVVGLFDATARLIYIDRTLHVVKQTFVRLHETAHGFLSWQRDLYAVVEDCEQTLSPETAELFDREANVFASEVLFQLDGFANEVADQPFGIKVPLRFAKKYGASLYSSIRQYVSKSPERCCVLVLNPPELMDEEGFRCELRRVVASESFLESMGVIPWPDVITPSDPLGALVPVGGRRMSRPRSIRILDQNGDPHDCVAEAFTQGYQVFVLLLASYRPARTVVPTRSGKLA